MKRYIYRFRSWADAYDEINDIVDDHFKEGPEAIERLVDEFYKQHKDDPAVEKAYRRWCERNDEPEEESQILYVIKDRNGRQLSSPNPDDGELWDRVESMEARGRRGLSVVVYTP